MLFKANYILIKLNAKKSKIKSIQWTFWFTLSSCIPAQMISLRENFQVTHISISRYNLQTSSLATTWEPVKIAAFFPFPIDLLALPGSSGVKNPLAMQVLSLGQEDPLEEGMATHSSILAWEIPWTEEPGRLESMGQQKSWI